MLHLVHCSAPDNVLIQLGHYLHFSQLWLPDNLAKLQRIALNDEIIYKPLQYSKVFRMFEDRLPLYRAFYQ